MRALAMLAVIACPATALADDAIVRGAVIKIEAQELYLNVGVSSGVSGGASVRIKRPVSLRHPITRAVVRDWVPVGAASVTQAGASMSRAVVGELVDVVKVGDIAEILVDRPDTRPESPVVPAPVPPPQPAGPTIDPETAELLGLFAAQAGRPIEARIAAWERYLSVRARSPYADAIRRDLEELQRLRDAMRAPSSAGGGNEGASVAHTPPRRALAGMQIPVAFVLDHPERVASAYLHYRTSGSRTYKSMLLARENDVYLRGTVPAEAVTAPGVDYFVEVSSPTGASSLALGSAIDPIGISVAKPSVLDRFGSAPGRSSVKLAADYLDFATLDQRAGDRTDRMFTATVDFTYRMLGSGVESFGVGYGVYAGSGGRRDMDWATVGDPPESGFHYGYADIEAGGTTDGIHLSAGGQIIAGVGKDGFGMGVEGRVRIGERDATNLAFIARTVSQVGFLSDIRFGARPAERLLLGISVGATTQPNQGDVGVKLGTELEILAAPSVSILLRGSWQGRSTEHGGVGGGGGLGFYW